MAEQTYDNFLGLPPEDSDYATAPAAVLPIPYDATTSYATGTREGPRAIISASQQIELYDDGLGREFTHGVATLPALEPHVRGPEQMHERIYSAAARVVNDGKFLLGLGGEHSVTSALVRAVVERYEQLSVLQIDAHADLRDSYQGSAYSHASVMRRIHDMEIPIVAIGIRSYSPAEAAFMKDADITTIPARQCHRRTDWVEQAVEHLTEQVYVTIDIDGFDPAYAPATGTPEPGGLDWYQVTDLLAAVAATRRIVAADIVEVKTAQATTVTEFLAARLAFRLLGLALPPTT